MQNYKHFNIASELETYNWSRIFHFYAFLAWLTAKGFTNHFFNLRKQLSFEALNAKVIQRCFSSVPVNKGPVICFIFPCLKNLANKSKYQASTNFPSCGRMKWLNSGSADTTMAQPATLFRNIRTYLKHHKKVIVTLLKCLINIILPLHSLFDKLWNIQGMTGGN